MNPHNFLIFSLRDLKVLIVNKTKVVHGGPGALGTVATIAQGLSDDFGFIEPLQTGDFVLYEKVIRKITCPEGFSIHIIERSSWAYFSAWLLNGGPKQLYIILH